jgi:hypothetical protein
LKRVAAVEAVLGLRAVEECQGAAIDGSEKSAGGTRSEAFRTMNCDPITRNRIGRETPMEINSIVIASLVSPKEKVWGQLVMLEAKGIAVRGIDLDAFDDFIRQVIQQEETAVGLNTVFFPMHRVERVMVDEPSGSIPSLSERFHSKVGMTIQEYMGIDAPRI